jgi:hypothetical protein
VYIFTVAVVAARVEVGAVAKRGVSVGEDEAPEVDAWAGDCAVVGPAVAGDVNNASSGRQVRSLHDAPSEIDRKSGHCNAGTVIRSSTHRRAHTVHACSITQV